MKTDVKQPIAYILAIFALIELLLFLWLCSLDQEGFMRFVSSKDTVSYTRIAEQLVDKGTLIASPRTLGYPLFLSLGYYIGGSGYGLHLIIAAQLALNLVFCWVVWRLLHRVAPSAGIGIKILATVFFFWAGLGMALMVLTDFLASLLFALSVYGLLFWRSSTSLLASGTALFLATFIRPTFTFLPFLLPAAAFFTGRFTSRVPWHHIIVLMLSSLAATAVSTAYQYSSYRYLGPSSVLAKNIAHSLYQVSTGPKIPKDEYYEKFGEKLAQRAGKQNGAISRSEEEKYAVQVFMEELKSRPKVIISLLFKTFIKYLFVPVESLVARLAEFYASEEIYVTYVRPIVGLICVPVWLLSFTPPMRRSKDRAYFLLMMTLVLYTVGVTAINPLQGERIRFPALAFMLPVMAWNLHTLAQRFRAWQMSRTRDSLNAFARNPRGQKST